MDQPQQDNPPSLSAPALSSRAFTPERRVRFLAELAAHGHVRKACAVVAVSPQAVYQARRRDAAFAAGWDAALVLGIEQAEQVLAARALDGVTETVWYRGEVVGQRTRFDTRLLLAWLARLDARAAHDHDARALAGRFDEYLACLLEGDPEPHRGFLSRDEAVACALAEMDAEMDPEPEDETDFPEDGPDPYEPDPDDLAVIAWAQARDQRAAQVAQEWDDDRAAWFAAVDAVLLPQTPPTETGWPAPDRTAREVCQLRQLGRPPDEGLLPPALSPIGTGAAMGQW